MNLSVQLPAERLPDITLDDNWDEPPGLFSQDPLFLLPVD